MGAKEDRDHFETYRAQTLTKHTILGKYLPAYFDIVGKANQRLVYIDAFAGAGYYTDDDGIQHQGSPLRALQLLVDAPRFRNTVRCIFAEPDKVNYPSLEQATTKFCDANAEIPKPYVCQMAFSELVAELRTVYGEALTKMAPGFVLVDPCGLAGASMSALATLLRQRFSEVFIFFNAAGLARVVGANLVDQVSDLYGDRDVAAALIDDLRGIARPVDREAHALNCYEQQLRALGLASHVCSFRIEYEDRAATSHYLIHATKHPLGFKIMKDIMWSEGSGHSLELRQASAAPAGQLTLELGDSTVDDDILVRLNQGPRPVAHFTSDLCTQPDNRIAAKYYKDRLLALEADGRLVVWRNGKPAPATSRPSRLGKPTLADSCEVRLPG